MTRVLLIGRGHRSGPVAAHGQRAQGPVDTVAAGAARQRLAHDRVGDAEAAGPAPRDGRREHRRRRPGPARRPAARRSCRGAPARAAASIERAHRPAAVGVLGEHLARRADAARRARRTGRSAGSRASRRRSRSARRRERAARGAPRPGTRRTATSLSASKRDRARVELRPVAAHLDHRVVLAGDHVRVRHDEPGAADPARALDARARTPCRAPARRCAPARAHVGVARDLRRGGGGTSASGPGDRRAAGRSARAR